MTSGGRKALSTLGMIMIGDAAAEAIGPRAHIRVWRWRGGPQWYRRGIAALTRSPGRVLAATAMEAAAGVLLVRLAQRGLD